MMHLICQLYLARPSIEAGQIDSLQAIINEMMPNWGRFLRVVGTTRTTKVALDRRLYDCIDSQLPKQRSGEEVTLEGSDGVSLYLSHSESSLPPEINDLTVEVFGIDTIEGRQAQVWMYALFGALTLKLPTRYGNVRLTAEYDAKNMLHTDSRTSAIGVQLSNHLPGLYWLNYFGPPYCDLMGRDRILTAPAYEVWPSGDGVIVSLAESAEEWETPAYQRREQAVIEHLGKPYFFSRHDPKRDSLAPDFYAIRKREGSQ